MRKILLLAAGAPLLGAIIGVVGLYADTGSYGFNVLLRRGGTVWVSVNPGDPRLSDSMRTALTTETVGEAGPLRWQNVGNGFDVSELPVRVGGQEVDRLLLARIDPHRYQFVVRNAAAGNMGLQDWMAKLHAAIVINGSYYSPHGTPDTPLLSDHAQLGPTKYAAREGAFVATDANASIDASASIEASASIVDLAHEDWQTAFRNADNALVSYPLLVGGDPTEHRIKPSDWLANRSFVGQDRAGQIILGTTVNAFFSLSRLATFLRGSPLDLTYALNLDGGPVACQAIAVGHYARHFCGQWEIQKTDSAVKLLTWPYGSWALPVVLAAIPKH